MLFFFQPSCTKLTLTEKLFYTILYFSQFRGDLNAIEQMAYEFCEQKAANNVVYAEARYCPHLLMPNLSQEANFLSHAKNNSNHQPNHQITCRAIVEAVNKGLQRGEADFGIVVRSILSCIRGKPEWSKEILELCVQFKDKGVVGIDIAGDEGGESPIEGEGSGK